MTVTITPGRLKGEITPPPSKSQAHRAVIAAAFARGESRIGGISLSEDIKATLDGVGAMGARWEHKNGGASVTGVCRAVERPIIDCGESGSTLRFLVPAALALCGGAEFAGRGRLMERPLGEYFRLFDRKGIKYSRSGQGLSVYGRLPAGEYLIRGDVSSQFVTGLLFALPLLDGDSVIGLSTPLESRGYVDMTMDILGRFGVEVKNNGYKWFYVGGGQKYVPCDLDVETDYSQAAFFFVANALGSSIRIKNLNPDSAQGDREIEDITARLLERGDIDIDVGDIPDLVPAIAVLASLREGRITRLKRAGRLRLKESDRLDAVAKELGALGARIQQTQDSLEIHGTGNFTGGEAESRGDHRIAMALAIAATRATGRVTISGAESVNKSYPEFWNDFKSLGGIVE